MLASLPTKPYFSDITETSISQSSSHKMEARASWHRNYVTVILRIVNDCARSLVFGWQGHVRHARLTSVKAAESRRSFAHVHVRQAQKPTVGVTSERVGAAPKVTSGIHVSRSHCYLAARQSTPFVIHAPDHGDATLDAVNG